MSDGPNGSGRIVNRECMVSRRMYLTATASGAAGLTGLSGCLGGSSEEEPADSGDESDSEESSGGSDDEQDDGHEEELPEGVSEEEFESGPVPEVYQSTLSLGTEERHADDLAAKDEVDFSEFDEAQEHSAHVAGTCCGNCADYIPDQNGDEFGACAEVQGYIDAEDWCAIYEELPEPETPEGMSRDELATAEVPEEYQGAISQGDEERGDPDDLKAQETVSLMESVEAIAEGIAPPGQSCGTCADFIPDKNGDTWGACAEVEGYVAVEDWCNVWEHISEEH